METITANKRPEHANRNIELISHFFLGLHHTANGHQRVCFLPNHRFLSTNLIDHRRCWISFFRPF